MGFAFAVLAIFWLSKWLSGNRPVIGDRDCGSSRRVICECPQSAGGQLAAICSGLRGQSFMRRPMGSGVSTRLHACCGVIAMAGRLRDPSGGHGHQQHARRHGLPGNFIYSVSHGYFHLNAASLACVSFSLNT